MNSLLLALFIATFATSAISITISRSKLFKSIRIFIHNEVSSGFYYLVSCHYCTSHWVAFTIQAHYLEPWQGGWIDYILLSFATVGASALLMGITLFFIRFNLDFPKKE